MHSISMGYRCLKGLCACAGCGQHRGLRLLGPGAVGRLKGHFAITIIASQRLRMLCANRDPCPGPGQLLRPLVWSRMTGRTRPCSKRLRARRSQGNFKPAHGRIPRRPKAVDTLRLPEHFADITARERRVRLRGPCSTHTQTTVLHRVGGRRSALDRLMCRVSISILAMRAFTDSQQSSRPFPCRKTQLL